MFDQGEVELSILDAEPDGGTGTGIGGGDLPLDLGDHLADLEDGAGGGLRPAARPQAPRHE